ncbi:non-ribosomal peptide synthetase [Colwellia psychrerythraea]|uniref:Amino acid adenylation domain protein n=1 Tax=Colwellia psychrerythraea TaxID=28229 RepID=A0A099L3K5_COLPS|nr:non-ribosomal peptide synthetase [Colwellia psychrerythraea]KGJ97529.1 amino acid adenylation domain protein [Colwellia psychrerythraea]
MSQQVIQRIAEKFHQLPSSKQQLVYQKIRQDGLSVRQFPVLANSAKIANYRALSYAQQRQWFLWHLDPDSSAYHISGGLLLEGQLDTLALQQVFNTLIDRHETLRTYFEQDDDGQIQQVVRQQMPFKVQHVDLQNSNEKQQDKALSTLTKTPFDLWQGPLIRVGLLQLAKQKYQLILVLHHIITDGVSLQILVDEFVTCYKAILAGESNNLSELPIQYLDYALWQHHWLSAGEQARQLSYWCQQLGDDHPVLRLQNEPLKPNSQPSMAAYYHWSLPDELSQQIGLFAQQQQASHFMVLLAAFQVLLHRHSGLQDIRVGTPVANRTRSELADVVGLFVNTQILRTQFDSHMSLGDVLAQVKAAALGAQEHQDLPFEQLVEALQPDRSVYNHPLFQVMLNYQYSDRSQLTVLPNLTVTEQDTGAQNAQFELILDVQESTAGEYQLTFTYAQEALDDVYVKRIAAHLQLVLQTMVENSDAIIDDIALLDQEELAQLRTWGVNTEQEDITPVHIKFEQQTLLQPSSVAVVFADQHLSYEQLNQQANQLAHYLFAQGINTESRIGVALERSLETAVVLLAILKAGALFVPLDTNYPAERLNFIIENSDLSLLISHVQARASLPESSIPILWLDDCELSHHATQNLNLSCHPEQLAYVIYTSGSTGRPKGAAISHQALSNCMAWMQRQYQPTREDAVLHKAAFGFDVSCWELFFPLSEGIKLVIAKPDDHRDPELIIQLMQQEQVTITNFPPAMQQAFLEQANIAKGRGLRQIMCGGEAVPAELKQQTYSLLPKVTMNNLYGPTETTIHVTHWPCANDERTLLPIGQPISATRTYVLDVGLNPVPQGVSGELYIAGLALARGYLARPDLTADRFVADSLAADGSRMYRTGDLVRWNTEGLLEYLGRIDDQVQIRGFRIELGEIEAQLHRLDNVQEAVVMSKMSPVGEQLVAYLVGNIIDTDTLALQLAKTLPDYMVPSVFNVLTAMPLSPNGKVNRKVLPEPQWQQQEAYVAPQGEVELKLALWWREMLNVAQVGRNDNFFSLGGHSLLAIQLLDKIRQAGWQVQVKTLFSQPVLKNFATVIQCTPDDNKWNVPANGIPDNCTKITPEMLPLVTLTSANIDLLCEKTPDGVNNIQDVYPLTPLQEGILFHHLLQQKGDAYITKNLMRFTDRNTLECFIADLNKVIARHDILRTAVLWQGLPEPLQIVQRQASLVLNWQQYPLHSKHENPGAWLTAFVSPDQYRIDIQQAPLLRAIAIQEPGQKSCWLQLPSHHLIMDHTSLEILVTEIQQIQAGQLANLPTPVPFRNFVAIAQQGRTAAEHQNFFSELLADVTVPTAPFNLLNIQGNGANIDKAEWSLPADITTQIRQLAIDHEVSAAAIFHLAWALVLSKLTGNENPVFGTVLFGRMHAGENSQHAVGMFINTLPIRFRLADIDLTTGLIQAHQVLTGLLDHDTASLTLAQGCSGVAKGTPLFSTLFNYRYSPPIPEEQQRVWPGVEVFGSEEQTNYPIGMSIDDQGTGFNLVAQSVAGISPTQLCTYLHQALCSLLNTATDNQVKRLSDVNILSDEQWKTQQSWSLNKQTEKHTPVHVQFAVHAQAQPAAEALSFAGKTMTYQALNQQANRLAHYLIAQGIGAESRVAVVMARSHEMIISLLAIMKTGALYVPLDIDYPADRLAYIVENSQVNLLLSHQTAIGKVPETTVPCDIWEKLNLLDYPNTDPALNYHPEQLAYAIYTSGSTGRPKGAAISHRSLANCMAWMQKRYKLTREDVVLHKAPFGFDVSCWEIFWPLSEGIKLVVAQPGDHKDPDRLISLIQQEAITTLNFVPAMQQAFLDQVDIRQRTSLKHIMVGGEAMPPELKRRTFELLPDATMYNLYGPTEATIHVTHWTCENDERTLVPIGAPISDTSTYVLDEYLNLVPPGISGELYLGGVGLARGYLQRPDLTADRFVANPFDKNGSRLYRTGDLVRWNNEGLLEYLGRLDHQIKIRGLRVELGEIEAQLCTLPEVQEAVVVAKTSPNGNKLAAFVVGQALDVAALKVKLSLMLPDYMIPSAFIVLADLPLSANGKVDRKALPAIEWQDESLFFAPQGGTEKALANIWKQVLGIDKISRKANFFEIGGDSISCLKVVSLAREQNYAIAVKQVFEYPVLYELASQLAVTDEFTVNKLDNAIVRLNQENTIQPPVFCLHDGFGKVWDYSALALSLNGQRTVYGLPFNRTQLSGDAADLIALVQQHLTNIRAIQPTGPYYLCGWSFGATLAHWLAAELQQQGQEVAQVVLLDPYVPPQVGENHDANLQVQLHTFFSLLLETSSLQVLANDPILTKHMLKLKYSSDITLGIEQLMQIVIAHASTTFMHGYQHINAVELFQLFAGFQPLFLSAINLKKLPRVEAPTQIFWTEKRPQSHHAWWYEWLANEQLESKILQTDHFKIVRAPEVLAEFIKE